MQLVPLSKPHLLCKTTSTSHPRCLPTDCPAPEAVALEIAQHIKETHSLPARYVMKLLPVSLTCFAAPEDLKGLTGQLVDKYFGTGEQKANY